PTSPDLPTAVIRSLVTTTVMSGRAGAPVASMTVTPVMASDFAGASSARPASAPAKATTVRQAVTCLIGPSGRRGEVGTDHDTTSGGAPRRPLNFLSLAFRDGKPGCGGG